MNLILGFTPFFCFFLLSHLSADLALWVAFAAAFVVAIRDFVESPSLRLLDVVSLTVFGTLALVRGFLVPGLAPAAVRILAELALFLPLAGSVAARRPFSLQYARIDETWPRARFRHVNYMTSIAWLIALAAMTSADTAAVILPLPLHLAVVIGVAALGLAVLFTLRYPPLMARRPA